MDKKEKVAEIIKRLLKVDPDPKVELNFSSPWELLAATILAAQATDKSVNAHTGELFKKFPNVEAFAKASPEEVDQYIKGINFHQNKAKLLVNCSKMIVEKFKGKVPDNMEDLDSLPGVARKTANVVLTDAFHKNEGIIVDTHIIRLAPKLGLTTEKDPVKIERDLMEITPQKDWGTLAHLLTLHGRYICTARPHDCSVCPLGDLCPEFSR